MMTIRFFFTRFTHPLAKNSEIKRKIESELEALTIKQLPSNTEHKLVYPENDLARATITKSLEKLKQRESILWNITLLLGVSSCLTFGTFLARKSLSQFYYHDPIKLNPYHVFFFAISFIGTLYSHYIFKRYDHVFKESASNKSDSDLDNEITDAVKLSVQSKMSHRISLR